MAWAQLDADHGGLCGLVAPRVELSGLGHGLLAGAEGALLAAHPKGDAPLAAAEVLGVAEMVVRGHPATRSDLELEQRALPAALLACLQESGDVALVRVHDPPREAGGGPAEVTAARIRSATRSTASLLRSKTFTKAKKG